MKNIKLPLLVAAVVALGVSMAFSAQNVMRTIKTPTNQMGVETNPLYSGGKYVNKITAAEAVACSGPCVLLGLQMGTGAASSYLTIRDTATADGSGSLAFRRIYFHANPDTMAINRLAFPVRFSKGISLTLSSIAADEEVTAIYLEQQ